MKTCMITGATSGIGKVTALELAKKGFRIIIVARNESKAALTIKEIKDKTNNDNIEFIKADLFSMNETRNIAKKFRYDQLDVLINNAGAIFWKRKITKEGFERTFALNYLSPFLLTNLLLDKLKNGRIINVSSRAHLSGKMHFDDLQLKKGYFSFKAYSQSKLALILFTYELSSRIKGTTVNALHPGFVSTNFGNDGIMKYFMPLANLFAISAEKGAQTTIYLASSSEVEGVTGKYFVKKKPVKSSKESYDVASGKRLWEISKKLLQDYL